MAKASPAESARERHGRALVVALGLAALAWIALAVLWARREGRASAPMPVAAEAPSDAGAAETPRVDPSPAPAEAAPAPPRAAVESAAPPPPRGREGLFLLGRVLDEAGLPLEGEAPRVDVTGFAGQRLTTPVDAAGRFGPLRLVPGAWQVTASAPGRRSATRAVEIVAGVAPEPIELVLPRVARLDVRLVAVGPGSEGDPERDLADLAELLSLHLSVAGEELVERRPLIPLNLRRDHGRKWHVPFQVVSGRSATVELHLGAERLLQRAVATDQSEVTLEVDPLDLRARLVELELVLRGGDGAPLVGLNQALLEWEGGAQRVAGQPGPDPSRARFELCPPGAARLSVVDVDGRRATVELFVPFQGPAELEVVLELTHEFVEPQQR